MIDPFAVPPLEERVKNLLTMLALFFRQHLPQKYDIHDETFIARYHAAWSHMTRLCRAEVMTWPDIVMVDICDEPTFFVEGGGGLHVVIAPRLGTCAFVYVTRIKEDEEIDTLMTAGVLDHTSHDLWIGTKGKMGSRQIKRFLAEHADDGKSVWNELSVPLPGLKPEVIVWDDPDESWVEPAIKETGWALRSVTDPYDLPTLLRCLDISPESIVFWNTRWKDPEDRKRHLTFVAPAAMILLWGTGLLLSPWGGFRTEHGFPCVGGRSKKDLLRLCSALMNRHDQLQANDEDVSDD